MARPNGVVIVSERYWAFATTTGELHEGEMPVRRSRPPGSRSCAACCSWRPRWRRSSADAASPGSASGSSSSLALLLPFAFVALPGRLELAAGILTTALIVLWLFRGRTLRLHGAEHRAIAAAEARLARSHLGGRGATEPLLAALRHELRRARDSRHGRVRPRWRRASSRPR